MPLGLGTAIGYLNLDITGFAQGIDSAVSDMKRLNTGFSTTAQGLQTIGGMFTGAGKTLTAGFTAPVIGFGAASVKAGTEFDTSMSKVAAVSKATGENLSIIRDRAIEMGEKTRYSATEVSDAMYYMGLAGWDAQQIYKGIPGVLALGAASGEDLARVSDIVTDSLTAFGKTADDTSEFVNVLAEASRSSNTTVDMLGESFKYVGPVAGAFGYSLQDVAIALGIFANNGVKGSQAGTGLRQALNALINPTDKSAAVMDKYGVSLFNANGSTKSFMTVMEELRGTFGGLAVDIHNADGEVMSGEEIMEKYGHSLPTTDMEKLTAIVQIFGVRALPGMLSVINAADEDFYSLSNAIYGAQDAYDGLGTAFGMQTTMLDNLQGDWYLFTSALGTTKIILSDMAKGALRELIQSLTELVNKFNEMDPEQQEQIVKWALIVASIGPVLIIIGKLITDIGRMITIFGTLKDAFKFVSGGVSTLMDAFKLIGTGTLEPMKGLTALQTAFAGLTGPIIAVIAIIAVLIVAFVNLWKNNEDFRNKIIEIWDGIKAKFEEAGDRIVEIFNELGFNFEDFKDLMEAGIELLKTLWDGFCELLAPIFTGAFAIIGDVIGEIVDIFVGVIEIIVGIVKGFKDGDWTMLWQGVGDVVGAVANTMISMLDHLGEMIWNLVETVAGWFGLDWNMTWEEAKQTVKNFFDKTVEWFTKLPDKIKLFLVQVIKRVKSWANNMKHEAKETGKNFLDNITNFFSKLPEKIAYYIGFALGKVVKWAIDMPKKAKEMAKNFLDRVIEFFTQLPGKIQDFITKALYNVKLWAADMVRRAKMMANDFLRNIKDYFSKLPGNVKNFLTNTITKVKTFATDMVKKAKEAAKGFFDNIVDGLKSLPDKMKEIGSNIVNGIWNGISSGWDWLKKKVADLAASLLKGAKDALEIASPSKKFRDEVGVWIPAGIAEGFKKAMPGAVDTIQTSINESIKTTSNNAMKTAGKVTTTYANQVGKDLANKLVKSIKEQNKKNKVTGAEAAKVLVDAASKEWDRYSLTHTVTLSDEAAFWKKIVDECKKGSDAYYQALEKYQSANNNLKESVNSLKENYKQAWSDIQENLVTDIQSVMDKYEDTLTTRTDNIKSQFGDMFAAYSREQTEDTKEVLTNNIRSQVEALDEWDNQMSMLASRSGITDAFMEEIESLGVDATDQLKLLNSMSDQELNEYLSLWNRKNQKAQEMAKKQLSDYEKQCEEQITILTSEANKELNELEKAYNESLAALGVTVSDQSESIGKNIVNGIIAGMQGRSGDLYSYVMSMCQRIIPTAQNALEIHSPSKLLANKVGKWLPLGIAEGFVDNMPDATKEIENSLNNGIDDIEVHDIEAGNTNLDTQISDFVETYQQVFESLVIWFETMEERMAIAIESLTEYFEYLMYVRQIIDNDDDFKAFVFGNNDNNPKKPTGPDVPSFPSDSGGDTFIFYSPKAIDEVQAARIFKNTKRDLSEGF